VPFSASTWYIADMQVNNAVSPNIGVKQNGTDYIGSNPWKPLVTNTASGDAMTFMDENASLFENRFYRVVPLP